MGLGAGTCPAVPVTAGTPTTLEDGKTRVDAEGAEAAEGAEDFCSYPNVA